MNSCTPSWRLALGAALLGASLAGCADGPSVVGGPADGAVANDLAVDVAADVPTDVPVDLGAPMDAAPDAAPDAPMDVGMDTPADVGPPRCMSAADCMTNPGRGA
jgi:hypothetical protein